MKKRILSLILSAVLILSMFMLASCGQRKLSRMNDEDLVEYLSEHLDGDLYWKDDKLVYTENTESRHSSTIITMEYLREEIKLLEKNQKATVDTGASFRTLYTLRDDLRKVIVDYYDIDGIVTEYDYYDYYDFEYDS